MKMYILLLLGLYGSLSLAAPPVARDSGLQAVETYVQNRLQGQSGRINVVAGPLDPRMRLPSCTSYQAYAPPGSRLLGNTNIGLRCLAPARWNIFVPVKIEIETTYVATASALTAGQTLQPNDLIVLSGDLGNLPAGVLTDPSLAVGKTLKYSLTSGQALRQDQLTSPLVIQQGQSVKLIFIGNGFTATNEGRAQNQASEGQLVQVRTQSGTVVSGIAQSNGTVLVGNTSP